LLGAIAAGDIGTYFPPSDPKWKGADSVTFLQEAMRRVARAGYVVSNVDSTLILARPKIGPHAAKIQARVAELLQIAPGSVGVKAKTPEGMGTEKAAIAHVVVLLVKKSGKDPRRPAAVEAVPQPEMDKIVNDLVKEVPEQSQASSKTRR
jgi:2-C-methyl-D-erythritol 2,4-cyclodiphosphate synthase